LVEQQLAFSSEVLVNKPVFELAFSVFLEAIWQYFDFDCLPID